MLVRRSPLALSLSLVVLAVVPACKGKRDKLEQLVPDGATGIMSVDAQALLKSEAYTKVLDMATTANPEVTAFTDKLRDDCELDYTKTVSYVVGFDVLAQGAMVAVRLPNIGKHDALSCAAKLMKDELGDEPFTLGEEDGKTKLKLGGGEAIGWALDDDTLVITTKTWAGPVQQRVRGEGKGAVDNYLAESVALVDRKADIWFAGQVPAIAASFLENSPAKGLERGGGSMKLGDAMELAITLQFAEDGQASDAKALVDGQLSSMKEMAKDLGAMADMLDGLTIETDGNKLTAKVEVPLAEIIEQTTEAFTKYISRSKTSEARVQMAKMFDAASAFFNEEHVDRSAIGIGGALPAPHRCPAMPNQSKGSSGIVPPLSVDCSKGPGGKCVPVAGGSDEPGHYALELWTDNDVFDELNFAMETPHFFHYSFRYDNDASGFGACQFTAQAFGDLDGDGTFSTYERAGAADENGVNAAAGLYIDQEIE